MYQVRPILCDDPKRFQERIRIAIQTMCICLSILLGCLSAFADMKLDNSVQSATSIWRSEFLEFAVPEHRRLGTFAIDLGLSTELDGPALKKQYVLGRVLARAVSSEVAERSNMGCNLALSLSSSFPYIFGFMYRGDRASEQVSQEVCFWHFREAFSSIEDRKAAVMVASRELAAENYSEQRSISAANMPPTLAVIRGIRQFERLIYADDAQISWLLNVQSSDYKQITVEAFGAWLQGVRQYRRHKFISEDVKVRSMLGADSVFPELPPMTTTKKSEARVRIDRPDNSALRAALIISTTKRDDAALQDLAKRVCSSRGVARGSIQSAPSPKCMWDDVFGRERWLAIYFDSSDGPDAVLDRLVEELARREQQVSDRPVGRGFMASFGIR